jgi:hypothetical protein
LCKPLIKEVNKVVYPWFLLIVWILWLVAIATNFLIDQKKGNGQITSYVTFLNVFFVIYYIIAYWVGKNAKGLRALGKSPSGFGGSGFETSSRVLAEDARSGAQKAGIVLYWFFLFTSLAGLALPAAMGGLSANKI